MYGKNHIINSTPIGDRKIRLVIKCFMCKGTDTLEVREVGLDQWEKGKYVQDAFPDLSPSQREMLISGTCNACFDRAFGD